MYSAARVWVTLNCSKGVAFQLCHFKLQKGRGIYKFKKTGNQERRSNHMLKAGSGCGPRNSCLSRNIGYGHALLQLFGQTKVGNSSRNLPFFEAKNS